MLYLIRDAIPPKACKEYIDVTCDSAQNIPTIESTWRVNFRAYLLDNDSPASGIYVVFDNLEALEERRLKFFEYLSNFNLLELMVKAISFINLSAPLKHFNLLLP